MTDAEINALIEKAAECGARRALAAIGLCDAKAADDMRDLRGVLEAFRLAKSAAWTTFVRLLTAAIFAAILAGVSVATWPEK